MKEKSMFSRVFIVISALGSFALIPAATLAVDQNDGFGSGGREV